MFKDNIPQSSLNLVKYSGEQLIDRLGKDIISKVVLSVLSGDNIRSLTEGLTQRRILLMNASLFTTYLRALKSYEDFEKTMTSVVWSEIERAEKVKRRRNDPAKLTANEKQYLYWFLGLTLKGIDNVARGSEGISEYLRELDNNLADIANLVEDQYGTIEMKVKLGRERIPMTWPSLLRCMLALGAQTLTIRGSEKSMYGKLFEKFVLGSVLTIMGGTYVNKNDPRSTMVFWLSDKDDKRECDATFLVRPNYGLSFDIGFIGKGNPEISLDKVTRFESRMERGGRRNFMTTIVLIDTIGDKSQAKTIAHEIGGHIIQMSGTYWVHELAHIIKDEIPSFENPLLEMTELESLEYLKEEVPKIDLSQFLSAIDLEEIDNNTFQNSDEIV
ncbi:MAG: CfrBI family restriction endonuclease [Prevotella sp.]|nr:CfrBI family restriction endonuclease [Prevotella sp.]